MSAIKIKMNVRIVDEKTGTVYLPTEEYICTVQPLPVYQHRPQVLAIQSEAMAKIKFVNEMYGRIHNEVDIRQRLQGKKWTIDAIVTEQVILDAAPA